MTHPAYDTQCVCKITVFFSKKFKQFNFALGFYGMLMEARNFRKLRKTIFCFLCPALVTIPVPGELLSTLDSPPTFSSCVAKLCARGHQNCKQVDGPAFGCGRQSPNKFFYLRVRPCGIGVQKDGLLGCDDHLGDPAME